MIDKKRIVILTLNVVAIVAMLAFALNVLRKVWAS